MCVYIIAKIPIHDRETYNHYETGFEAILNKHTGFVTSVDENPEVLEGDWPYTRTALLTLRSDEQVRN